MDESSPEIPEELAEYIEQEIDRQVEEDNLDWIEPDYPVEDYI